MNSWTTNQKKIHKLVTEKVLEANPDAIEIEKEGYSIYNSFDYDTKVPIFPAGTIRLDYKGQYTDLSVWITPDGMIVYCFDSIDFAGMLKCVTVDFHLFELRDQYKNLV